MSNFLLIIKGYGECVTVITRQPLSRGSRHPVSYAVNASIGINPRSIKRRFGIKEAFVVNEPVWAIGFEFLNSVLNDPTIHIKNKNHNRLCVIVPFNF